MQPKGELEIANARPWGGCRAGHVSVPRYQTPRSGLKFPPWTGPPHTTHHTPHTHHTWGSRVQQTLPVRLGHPSTTQHPPSNSILVASASRPEPDIPRPLSRSMRPRCPRRVSVFADASRIIRISQSRRLSAHPQRGSPSLSLVLPSRCRTVVAPIDVPDPRVSSSRWARRLFCVPPVEAPNKNSRPALHPCPAAAGGQLKFTKSLVCLPRLHASPTDVGRPAPSALQKS
jgi:hypothetical protein